MVSSFHEISSKGKNLLLCFLILGKFMDLQISFLGFIKNKEKSHFFVHIFF